MSRGLVLGCGVMVALGASTVGWELWTDSYVSPETLTRTLALTGLAAIAGGLAWLTRV